MIATHRQGARGRSSCPASWEDGGFRFLRWDVLCFPSSAWLPWGRVVIEEGKGPRTFKSGFHFSGIDPGSLESG